MSILKKTIMLAAAACMAYSGETFAGNNKVEPVYMFGFSASFNDSTVYMTDVQLLDSAWIEDKTKFLMGRENYSYQLRDYFASEGLPNRTCVVVYASKLKDINKKASKLKDLYINKGKGHYLFENIPAADFQFKYVDMGTDEPTADKPKPKKEKKPRKDMKRPDGKRPEGMGGPGGGGMSGPGGMPPAM